MPLCKPTSSSQWNGVFWKEIEKSAFLVKQKHKPGPRLGDPFRIILLHNNYVVAHAATRQEIDTLWEFCLRFTDLVLIKFLFNLQNTRADFKTKLFFIFLVGKRRNEISLSF